MKATARILLDTETTVFVMLLVASALDFGE